jgi:hypothetical protein
VQHGASTRSENGASSFQRSVDPDPGGDPDAHGLRRISGLEPLDLVDLVDPVEFDCWDERTANVWQYFGQLDGFHRIDGFHWIDKLYRIDG